MYNTYIRMDTHMYVQHIHQYVHVHVHSVQICMSERESERAREREIEARWGEDKGQYRGPDKIRGSSLGVEEDRVKQHVTSPAHLV
jgi:hypothetical protein